MRNRCRDILRRRSSAKVVDLTTAEAAGDRGTIVADLAAATLDKTAFRAAFSRLSVDDRTILLLHHLHGMPVDDVARQLGVPVGTAKSRLYGARRALERALETQR